MTLRELFSLGHHMIFHGFDILSESEQIRLLNDIGMDCTKESRRRAGAFDKNSALLRRELVRVGYSPSVDLDVTINNAFDRAAKQYFSLVERRRIYAVAGALCV